MFEDNLILDPIDITDTQRLILSNTAPVALLLNDVSPTTSQDRKFEEVVNPVSVQITNFLTEFHLTNAGTTALLKLIKTIAFTDQLDDIKRLPSDARSFLRTKVENQAAEDLDSNSEKEDSDEAAGDSLK